MSKLLQETLKADMAIIPQAIAPAAQAISRFFHLRRERKALAIVQIMSADLQDTDVLDIGIVDESAVAPAASGDLAALVAAADPGVLAFQHVTASVLATVVTIDTTASADGAITINGVVFPYDAAPVVGSGEWDNAAALVIEINTLLPTLHATAAGAVVTIVSTDPGDQTITVTETVTQITVGDLLTTQAIAILEVDASQLVPGATTIAVVVDNPVANTGTITASVALIRGDGRYNPVPQAVA